jgi:hypothetical protein
MSPTKAFLQIHPLIGRSVSPFCSLLVLNLVTPLRFLTTTTDTSHSGNEAPLAYSTAQTRWPKIIVAAISDVEATLSSHVQDIAEIEDSKHVVKDLQNLL